MKNYENINRLADFLLDAGLELKDVVANGTTKPKDFYEAKDMKSLELGHIKKYMDLESFFLNLIASHGGELFEDNQSTWQPPPTPIKDSQTTWEHPPETLRPLIFAQGFKVDNMSGILVTDASEHLKCTLHEEV